MTTASLVLHQLRASYAFMERNLNLVKRYWTWELVWMVYSIAESLSVSFIGMGMEYLSGDSANIDGQYLVLYLVVGTLVWRYLSTVFYWITELISIERWEGTIEYTLMAPIHRLTHMAGQTFFAVIYSMFFTGVILGATALIFDLDLSNANLWGGTLMLLSGCLSFVGISIMASTLPLLFPERGAQMTHIVIALLLLVSGVYYPIEVLPNFLQKLAVFSPATYVLNGVRQALLDGTRTPALWPYMWPALLMGVVAIPSGLWVFKQAERYAKKKGKLHRNG
ncbi:MAG: ABC transporter permease [Chloroflexota bacterium]|nr:MAG: ABC transporter permease [Chloroflexota bacterium]